LAQQPLGTAAQALIATKVDELFERLKLRYLGPSGLVTPRGDKRILIAPWVNRDLTLEGVFHNASALEGVHADPHGLKTIVNIAGTYLDAAREQAKAEILREVTTFLTQTQTTGVSSNLQTVLGGKLSEVMARVSTRVETIVDAETATAKNIGLMDGIGRINAHLGIADPVVFFIVVRDGELCKECKRVHLLEDGVTPRLWLLSEVKQGYHTRGEDRPSTGGLHPHCRCTMATLMPGFGFTAGGAVTYKSPDYDGFKHQRMAA
jgi:hypothetical protein